MKQVAERVRRFPVFVCPNCGEWEKAGFIRWPEDADPVLTEMTFHCAECVEDFAGPLEIETVSLPDLLSWLRTQAAHEAELVSLTRGQDEESIAVSSMHAGKAQAFNSVANCLEAQEEQ